MKIRYPSTARTEIREGLALPLIVLALGGLVLLGNGLAHIDTTRGLLQLAGAALAAYLWLSLWRAREWARWVTVAGSILVFGLGCVAQVRGISEADVGVGWGPGLSGVLMLLAWGATAIYLLLPRTGRVFEIARRGEPVPRGSAAEEEAPLATDS